MRGRREAETETQERGERRDRDRWKEEPAGTVELGGGGQTPKGQRQSGAGGWVGGWGNKESKAEDVKGREAPRGRGGGDCSPNMEDACDGTAGTAEVHLPAPSTPATGMLPAAGPSLHPQKLLSSASSHIQRAARGGPVQVGQVGTAAPLPAWGGGCRRHFRLFSGVHVPCLQLFGVYSLQCVDV